MGSLKMTTRELFSSLHLEQCHDIVNETIELCRAHASSLGYAGHEAMPVDIGIYRERSNCGARGMRVGLHRWLIGLKYGSESFRFNEYKRLRDEFPLHIGTLRECLGLVIIHEYAHWLQLKRGVRYPKECEFGDSSFRREHSAPHGPEYRYHYRNLRPALLPKLLLIEEAA